MGDPCGCVNEDTVSCCSIRTIRTVGCPAKWCIFIAHLGIDTKGILSPACQLLAALVQSGVFFAKTVYGCSRLQCNRKEPAIVGTGERRDAKAPDKMTIGRWLDNSLVVLSEGEVQRTCFSVAHLWPGSKAHFSLSTANDMKIILG